MYLTISDLFKRVNSQSHPVAVKCSYMEIYNEAIRDLLDPSSSGQTLDLREDPSQGVSVAGITEYPMNGPEDVFTILREGAKRRTTDSHLRNQASSRSHAVLIISVNQHAGVRRCIALIRSRHLTALPCRRA